MIVRYKESWASVEGHWIESPERGYGALIARIQAAGGVLGEWSLLCDPSGPPSMYLSDALRVACASWSHPYQRQFLLWANETANHALRDQRFAVESENSRKGWKIRGVFPGNHGETLAAAALARAMADDVPPDNDMLVQAADEILQTARESKGSDWDNHIEQGRYVRAIQLLLIAGKPAEAKALFKTRRSLKHVQLLYRWLEGVVASIPEGALLHVATETEKLHFSERFDLIRDPKYMPAPLTDNMGGHIGQNLMLLRLELALIKQRYVLGQPYAGRWRDIVGLIAE